MSKAKVRNQCPICGESSSKFVCRMGKEYLETSAEGWQLDPLRNRMTGLDFEADTEAGINYVECDGCGTFYVDSVYPVEDTFASLQEEIPISDRYSNTNSANLIRNLIKRMHTDSALIRMALDSTSASDPKVLDYGCGIGWDLSIFRAMGIRNVVGYNIRDYMFPAIKHHMQPAIRLLNDREELEKLGPFDAIRCNSVLEHVEDPNLVAKDVFDLLKPGGIAHFSAPMVSRSVMTKYANNVAAGKKVKNLHEGHLQIWNRDTLPLSEYIQSKGFEIIPLIGGTGHYDARRFKKAFRFAAEHGWRAKQIITGHLMSRSKRFRHWVFLARKPV